MKKDTFTINYKRPSKAFTIGYNIGKILIIIAYLLIIGFIGHVDLQNLLLF